MEVGPVVLDTDTLSELCRGNLRVRTRATAYLHSFGRLTTTAVTVFERLRGYQLAIRRGKPFERQLQAFELLVATCIVLPFDSDAASVAARIWASLSRAQQQGVGDIMIAAVAVSRQVPVVTRNRGDFERISRAADVELKLLDWAS
jgi:predicted nucleic acid-binding protein